MCEKSHHTKLIVRLKKSFLEREAEGENEERQNDDARIDGNPDVISSTGVACECV